MQNTAGKKAYMAPLSMKYDKLFSELLNSLTNNIAEKLMGIVAKNILNNRTRRYFKCD